MHRRLVSQLTEYEYILAKDDLYIPFASNKYQVIEGGFFVLQCMPELFPPAKLTYITNNHDYLLSKCDTYKCSVRLKASRHIAGNYHCTATNDFKKQISRKTIMVLCKDLYFFYIWKYLTSLDTVWYCPGGNMNRYLYCQKNANLGTQWRILSPLICLHWLENKPIVVHVQQIDAIFII